MKVEKLPRKTMWLWQIRFAVINFIIIGLCVYFYASYKFLFYAGALITAVCLFTIIFYIPLFVRSYRIRCTKGGVVINRGVIIKTTHIMPYSKLIYTQTFTTPLAKILGLKALSLKAARSRILVPELPEADAETLLKILAEGEIK
jgi:membrane protein YdbS with pleckstrin-like domain